MATGRTPTIRRLTSDDLPAAAAALASAFADDPVFTWILGRGNQPKLVRFFTGQLAEQLADPDHCVDVDDSGRAVALWKDVDEWVPSPEPQLSELWPLIRFFGLRIFRVRHVTPAMDAAHPAGPHRYLKFIGAHTNHQGSGLGSALLRSMLDECDQQGLPAYLESSNPVNNALYHRFGFEDRGLVGLPKGAPPLMSMWRDPR